MEGWISLYRKIQEHWLWTKKRKFSQFEAWIYILFKANHKDTKIMLNEELVVINKGSFITSEVQLAKDWCWNRSTVRKFLTTLEKDKMIRKNTTSKYTSVSVENWELYQNAQHQNQHQDNINATSRQHQRNTDNNINNDNKINNENKKEIKKKNFEDVFKENNFSKELEGTFRDFIDMRKTIKKPMTTKALELLIKNLGRLTNLEAEKIAILNQSIEHCWQTVYPLQNKETASETNKYDYKGDDTL